MNIKNSPKFITQLRTGELNAWNLIEYIFIFGNEKLISTQIVQDCVDSEYFFFLPSVRYKRKRNG